MASSSSTDIAGDFYLEDFGRRGLAAEIAHLERQPGFATIREHLLAEGRAAGERAATERFAAERRALVEGPLQDLAGLLAGLKAERAEYLRHHERELLQLAAAIARRVVRAELRANPDVLAGKLAELAAALDRETSYVVRVNPGELEGAAALLAAAGRDLFGDSPHRIKPDPRLPRGAVALEGEQARLESICGEELDRIESLLLERHEAGAAEDADDA